MTVRDSLRKIGAAFLSTREVSAQECVYRCMPELWLRKTFPTTIYVSTDLPENRLRVAKSQNELDALDDCSIDIFKSNIIERYTYRPKAIVAVDRLCLAEFVAHYYKDYRSECSETNDAQPDVLTDNVIESQHVDSSTDVGLPHKIRLLNTNEVMKCRKVKAVIRFHTPSKRKDPEKYFHHLLSPLIFLCCPLGITTTFSKIIRCAISICSSFSNSASSGVISSKYKLLHTAWHGTLPFKTFKWQVLQMYPF